MKKSSILALIFATVMGVALISCDTNTQKGSGTGSGTGQGMMSGGTGWGAGAFGSNGERIISLLRAGAVRQSPPRVVRHRVVG